MGKRRLETYSDFERALRNGFGIGAGESYTPWFRAQDISSKGRSTKLPGIRVKREHHFVSDHEKRTFLIAEYQPSIIDIREQFPLLPLSLAQDIAEQAGISYPKHPVTKQPIVITTDFLLTSSCQTGNRYTAVPVKPSAELLKTRVREKLEIERLWWGLLNAEWRLVTDLQLDRIVADNLDWLSDPLRGIKKVELEDQLPSDAREQLISILKVGLHTWEELIQLAAKTINRDERICSKLLRAMAWERVFEVDLSIAIQREGIIRIERINTLSKGAIDYETAS